MSLTFHNQRTGNDLGRAWIEDRELRCNTRAVASMIENWTGSPQGFIDHYRGYANGYIYVQETE